MSPDPFPFCPDFSCLFKLAKSIPVKSLILSSHIFFCLHLFLFLSLCPVGLSLLNQKTLRRDQTTFLDQGQEFSIFSNACLDLSANLLIGNMVLVRNVPQVAYHLKGLLFSLTVVKVHDSQAYRNMEMTREGIRFTFGPKECFYPSKWALAL